MTPVSKAYQQGVREGYLHGLQKAIDELERVVYAIPPNANNDAMNELETLRHMLAVEKARSERKWKQSTGQSYSS